MDTNKVTLIKECVDYKLLLHMYCVEGRVVKVEEGENKAVELPTKFLRFFYYNKKLRCAATVIFEGPNIDLLYKLAVTFVKRLK